MKPQHNAAKRADEQRAESAPQAALTERLDRLWTRAEQHVPGWRSINLRLGSAEGPAIFSIDEGNGGQPQLRSTLSLNRATGDVVRWEPFAAQTAGRRLRSWTRFFAHAGEYYGLVGQTVAGIASAGAVVLVVTGLSLALRRAAGWRGRRAAPAREAARSEAA